ncbi:hypothetical protein VU04_11430, partial [Desulfobulbus sp. TB]|nr:hypothetical protein [Desulfobulbus sp. TB]
KSRKSTLVRNLSVSFLFTVVLSFQVSPFSGVAQAQGVGGNIEHQKVIVAKMVVLSAASEGGTGTKGHPKRRCPLRP